MSYFEDFEEWKLGEEEWNYNLVDNIEPKKYIFQTLNNKWKTRKGEVMKVSEMTTNHIINSLNKILRICNKEGWNATDYPIYRHLINELNIRKEKI